MRITREAGKFRVNKSLNYFHCEAGLVGVEEAANAYQSASMTAVGSGAHGVGLLSGVTNLFTSFLHLQTPSLVKSLGSAKRAVITLSSVNALTWLPIFLVMLLSRHIDPSLLIVLWVVNLVPGMVLGPIRSAWIVSLIKADERGKFLALRLSIITTFYLVSFYAMGYLLHLFSGENVHIGFAIIFLGALVASFLPFFMYLRISESPELPQTVQRDDNFSCAGFLREMRTTNLGRFVLFASQFYFAVYLAAPFFAVYMLNELRFDYITFAIVSSSELAARVVAMPIWGHYVNRFGNLKFVRMASYSIPLVPLLWLVSPNVVYLVLVQIFSGTVWAAFDLCAPNFIYQSASPKKRLKYIVYHKALSSAGMALGSITAILLLNKLSPVLGSQVLALFLLSGILRFAVVTTMLPRVRDLSRDRETCLKWPLLVPNLSMAIVPSNGLFHRPEQWSQFGNLLQVTSRKAKADVGTRRVGIISKPREWRLFNMPLAMAAVSKKAPTRLMANGGLFYRPREWHWFDKSMASMGRIASQVPMGFPVSGSGIWRPNYHACY